MYYNCGASVDGARVKSKTQLRKLLASAPGSVYFDGTSMFDQTAGYKGDEIPTGVILSVVLPDPYRDRRSYATVQWVRGQLKVM